MSRNESRNNAPLVLAAIAGIALIVLLRNIFAGDAGGDRDPSGGDRLRSVSGDCTRLTVVASSEKAALLTGIADHYADTNPEVDGRCASVSVSGVSSGAAMAALVEGWDEDRDGPRPDVWTPAASTWVVILQQRLAKLDKPNLVPDKEIPHIVQSPMVIAMPRPMAEALGWPKRAIGWTDLFDLSRDRRGWGRFGHPEWGPFRLGKTNPNFSTSGLNATIGAYFAATGLSSDLTLKDVRAKQTRDFVRQVESSVVHYGDISLTFLENLRRADDAGAGLNYISAVTIEEKSVWDYNQGNATGDPALMGKHPKPRTPLAAVYPKEGTLLSDHPYVTLEAPWMDDAKRAVAQDFLDFLHSDGPQERFRERAFRDFHGRPGDGITPELGLLPDRPEIVLDPPAPEVLHAVQRSWEALRKRARVLLIVDVSGSMSDPAAEAGATKLDLAKRAALSVLGDFTTDDEVGLWVFSTDQEGTTPYREVVPISPIQDIRGKLRSAIRGLFPQGGTALYATLREASSRMRSDLDPDKINGVILLTDGRNEYPGDTNLDSLIDEIEVEDQSRSVRVFPIAYGTDAALDVLERIANASGGHAYDASDPTSIVKVFTAAVSNF